jgi:hypothetical protein
VQWAHIFTFFFYGMKQTLSVFDVHTR